MECMQKVFLQSRKMCRQLCNRKMIMFVCQLFKSIIKININCAPFEDDRKFSNFAPFEDDTKCSNIAPLKDDIKSPNFVDRVPATCLHSCRPGTISTGRCSRPQRAGGTKGTRREGMIRTTSDYQPGNLSFFLSIYLSRYQ